MKLPGFFAEQSLTATSTLSRMAIATQGLADRRPVLPATSDQHCFPAPKITCEPGIEGTCTTTIETVCIDLSGGRKGGGGGSPGQSCPSNFPPTAFATPTANWPVVQVRRNEK
jgi:hypothetical protein